MCSNPQQIDRIPDSIDRVYETTRLDKRDIELIANLVAKKLAVKLAFATTNPTPIKKMTVKEFAAAIQRKPEHVRRQIRVEKIPRAEVDGPPYLISPRALVRFDVKPEEAQARIIAWKQAQNQPPSTRRSAA